MEFQDIKDDLEDKVTSKQEEGSEKSVDDVPGAHGDLDLTTAATDRIVSKVVRKVLKDLNIVSDENTNDFDESLQRDDDVDDASSNSSKESGTSWETVSEADQRDEYEDVVQGLLTGAYIGERVHREMAEARIYQVEKILNQDILTSVENLRHDVMKLSILLNEPNKARDDIQRSLNEKDSMNRVLEERICILKNQYENLRKEFDDCLKQLDILKKNNMALSQLVNKNTN